MTDAELITRFLDGHVASFNTLVWRWQKRLYNFVLRYVGDPEEARDLSQQVFIRAFRNLGELRDPERFSTWLYQIAVNLSRDRLRQRQRHPTLSLDQVQQAGDLHAELVSSREHPLPPDAGAQIRDLRDLLARALQSIPEEQRVVIVMKEYQELKFVEIAEILQISINTAKSRLYQGLKALKKRFDQWGISEENIGYEL